MLEQLTHLKGLLLEDRGALLSGDFSQLSATSTAVDGMLMELEKSDQLAGEDCHALLIEVRDMAARNAKLMAAGMEGAKAAKEKVEAIRRATSELHTYTSAGQVENVTPPPGKVEKRA